MTDFPGYNMGGGKKRSAGANLGSIAGALAKTEDQTTPMFGPGVDRRAGAPNLPAGPHRDPQTRTPRRAPGIASPAMGRIGQDLASLGDTSSVYGPAARISQDSREAAVPLVPRAPLDLKPGEVDMTPDPFTGQLFQMGATPPPPKSSAELLADFRTRRSAENEAKAAAKKQELLDKAGQFFAGQGAGLGRVGLTPPPEPQSAGGFFANAQAQLGAAVQSGQALRLNQPVGRGQSMPLNTSARGRKVHGFLHDWSTGGLRDAVQNSAPGVSAGLGSLKTAARPVRALSADSNEGFNVLYSGQQTHQIDTGHAIRHTNDPREAAREAAREQQLVRRDLEYRPPTGSGGFAGGLSAGGSSPLPLMAFDPAFSALPSPDMLHAFNTTHNSWGMSLHDQTMNSAALKGTMAARPIRAVSSGQ